AEQRVSRRRRELGPERAHQLGPLPGGGKNSLAVASAEAEPLHPRLELVGRLRDERRQRRQVSLGAGLRAAERCRGGELGVGGQGGVEGAVEPQIAEAGEPGWRLLLAE